MQLIRINNISDFKLGDKIAIANSNKDFKNLIGDSINLTTGEVIDCAKTYILVSTKERSLTLTNISLTMQAVYLITDENRKNNCFTTNEIELERKLRKAEKSNRRYKAILTKRFNVTEEELDLNFKRKTRIKNKYSQYKIDYKDVPYIENDEVKFLRARLVFKENIKRHIMCEITVAKDNETIISRGIAVCHREDAFNQTIGEIIASTKALKDLTCKLY